jgi:hypothetical protein
MNHVVNEVHVLNMPRYDDSHCRQEHDSFYGYALNTKAGTCTIVFRNSSNGHYGGSCELDSAIYPDIIYKDISNLSDWTAYEKTSDSYYSFLKFKPFW